ncbi:MAG: M56 family metallopeptidase [Lachnospiraceae bacterium]|nr:M56 family metallopeptidase [Lachnospiraceae bacterium]
MLENMFIEILNMSLTASVVILAVCVIRFFWRGAPKIFSYILWAVVLFRLLCPFSLESAFSLLGAVNGGEAAQQGRMEYISSDIAYQAQPQVQLQVQLPAESASDTVNEVINETVSTSLPAADVGDSVNPVQVMLFVGARVWLLGLFGMAVYQVVSLLKFRKRLSGAWREEGNIYRLPGGGTPFVYGLIRPRIYLPEGLSEEEQRYMLLHEQIHIRRGDLIFRFLGCVALCLHWFHPLVWLAFFLSARDMELSCDEAVLRKLGNGVKKEYSGSLLSLACGGAGKEKIRGIPVAFGEGDVKSRIKNVLGYQKAKPVVVAVAAVVCILAVAALALNPTSDPEEDDTTRMVSDMEEADTTKMASDTGESDTTEAASDTGEAFAAGAASDMGEADVAETASDTYILDDMIYDESHNIYSGTVTLSGADSLGTNGNTSVMTKGTELRAMVTRQGNALTFSVVTRSGAEDSFEGEINGEDSFYVENSDGGHLEGYATADEDGEIYLYVWGNAFGENVSFAFYPYTFYEIGADDEDYYSGSDSVSVTSSQAEYFAAFIKAAVAAGDRQAFAQMISYPITLRLEEEVVVADDEELLLYYDDLMEYENFAGNAADIFTKYMFANSLGVCVDDGMIWFAQDSEGECKIYAINP